MDKKSGAENTEQFSRLFVNQPVIPVALDNNIKVVGQNLDK
jgi:hypothetical protein